MGFGLEKKECPNIQNKTLQNNLRNFRCKNKCQGHDVSHLGAGITRFCHWVIKHSHRLKRPTCCSGKGRVVEVGQKGKNKINWVEKSGYSFIKIPSQELRNPGRRLQHLEGVQK